MTLVFPQSDTGVGDNVGLGNGVDVLSGFRVGLDCSDVSDGLMGAGVSV